MLWQKALIETFYSFKMADSGLDRFKKVAEIIDTFKNPNCPYKNIVIDDFNYLAQDFYMANAMKGGWDTPKQIGYGMGLIFDSFKGCPENKNIICCAHYEEYKDMKTVEIAEEVRKRIHI